jgi:hypothetical protein
MPKIKPPVPTGTMLIALEPLPNRSGYYVTVRARLSRGGVPRWEHVLGRVVPSDRALVSGRQALIKAAQLLLQTADKEAEDPPEVPY